MSILLIFKEKGFLFISNKVGGFLFLQKKILDIKDLIIKIIFLKIFRFY
jgi:hypothetical protein